MGNRFQCGLTVAIGTISVADAYQLFCLWERSGFRTVLGHLTGGEYAACILLVLALGLRMGWAVYRSVPFYLGAGVLLGCAEILVLNHPASFSSRPALESVPLRRTVWSDGPPAFADMLADTTQGWKRIGQHLRPVIGRIKGRLA